MARVLPPLLILAAIVAAYHSSFGVPFVFDDPLSIADNPNIRRLWPLWKPLASPPQAADAWRPLVTLTLAINYALGGLRVWGYHAVNLAIHAGAALALYGLVRRTMQRPNLQRRFGDRATWLAGSIALLWAVHPLNTQSVTYIIQRAEALMGLWYLLTLYAMARSAEGPHPGRWRIACVVACTLGMLSKPVMVTAPAVALLYDRTFLSGSAREALRRRGGLYAALAGTWLILAALWWGVPRREAPTAGFGLEGLTPIAYARTQPSVILHYLRLAVSPHPLVLDYNLPPATAAAEILPPLVVVAALLAVTWWALRRVPAAGFLGAWVFGILAPSSSIVPIADLAFEHRMYLPLAGLVALAVVGADAALAGRRWRRPVAFLLVLAVSAAFGAMTVRRNADYRGDLTLWRDVVAKRPQNPRAHNNVGLALATQGRYEEAIRWFEQSLTLKPDYAQARSNLGVAFAKQGRLDEAVAHYREAIRLEPRNTKARNNLGMALIRQGRWAEAEAAFREALGADEEVAQVHSNLGLALARQGRLDEAMAAYARALELDPDHADAHNNLGDALARRGDLEGAVAQFHAALRVDPQHPMARRNLDAVQQALRERDPVR